MNDVDNDTNTRPFQFDLRDMLLGFVFVAATLGTIGGSEQGMGVLVAPFLSIAFFLIRFGRSAVQPPTIVGTIGILLIVLVLPVFYLVIADVRKETAVTEAALDGTEVVGRYCSFVLMLVFGAIYAFRPVRKSGSDVAGDSIDNHEGYRGHEEDGG